MSYPPHQVPFTSQRAVSESSRHTSGRDLTGTRRQQLARGTEDGQQFAKRREAMIDFVTEHQEDVSYLLDNLVYVKLLVSRLRDELARELAEDAEPVPELVGSPA
jgi:hypothetical protein